MYQIKIVAKPPQLDPELASAIVGISVRIRPELLLWTTEPTYPETGKRYFVHNDDLRAVLTDKLGISTATLYYLPIGRTTPIPVDCCEVARIAA